MTSLLICLAGVLVVVGGIIGLRLHAFLALLLAAFVVSLLTPVANVKGFVRFAAANQIETDESLPDKAAAVRVAEGLGAGCGKVAIIIAFAAIVGQCLLISGAAERVVRSITQCVGVKRSPIAFVGSGFILGIPVYFDTVFYLMIPLVRNYARKNGNYVLAVLSMVAGATMAHSLVPPTPGPLLVASRMEISLGTMFLVGIPLGLFTSSCGFLYASWADRKFGIPMREVDGDRDFSGEVEPALPSLGWAVLPILAPLTLISAQALLKVLEIKNFWLATMGDPNVAMGIGAALAMLLVARSRPAERRLAECVQQALSAGGGVILITAAGAAFGAALSQTNIAEFLSEHTPKAGGLVLFAAFLLTALVRFAQGSATVSMLTAIGIIAPLAASVDLGFHPVYLAMAIGCGSKLLPWMNDSGFWIFSKMTGLTELETLKTFSAMLTFMGMAGMVAVFIASRLLPMSG